MKKGLIIFLLIGLIFISAIAGCVPEKITQKNVPEIAAKMDMVYNNINSMTYNEKKTFKTKILSYEEFKEKSTARDEKDIEDGYELYKQSLTKDIAEGKSEIIDNHFKITIFETTVHMKKPGKWIIDTPISEQTVVATPDYNYIIDKGKVMQFPCPNEPIVFDYEFLGILSGLTKKYDMTYIATEEVNGREAFRFDLTYANTAELTEEEEFGDYAGGLWIDIETFMPLKSTTDPKGDPVAITEWTNYKINIDISDDLFSAPPEVKPCF